MASTLNGLFRKLTWADFTGPVPDSNPDNMWAQAAPGFSPAGVGTVSTDGTNWYLKDTVVISINFNSANSWVLPSVKDMSEAEKTRLLSHEQGHYNLLALLARDFFLELMQLKSVSFPNSAALSQKVRDIHTSYHGKGQPLQDLYDSKAETDHGKESVGQAKWDAFIEKSFTTPRTPPLTTPDGTVYKLEILKIIKDSGLII